MVVDGVMYVSSAWSKVFALDAASGALVWKYDPAVKGAVAFGAGCDVVNRGVAVAAGTVYVGTTDGRLVALSVPQQALHGMIGFRAYLSDADAEAVRAYVNHQSQLLISESAKSGVAP